MPTAPIGSSLVIPFTIEGGSSGTPFGSTVVDRPRLQVLAGGRDITNRCESITFSSVDRGGYEICTLGLPAPDRPPKGTRVTVRQGLEVAWDGRVAEVVDHSVHGRATRTMGCEGYQAILRDKPLQMVYVDRELSQWQGPSITRLKILLEHNIFEAGNVRVAANEAGEPVLLTALDDSWTEEIERVEAWYDAGPGNLIGDLYYQFTAGGLNSAETEWEWAAGLQNTLSAVAPEYDITGNLRAASGEGDLAATAARRYAAIYEQYTKAGGAGTAGVEFWLAWVLAVYGPHGLPKRGPAPSGFYPSDIVGHVLSQTTGITAGVLPVSTSYIAPHVVYRTPTERGQIINDMAKLLGWTWGVWEPPTILGTLPRLDFRPPPPEPTCAVLKQDCDELDITSRLGDLYNECVVSYTNAAGETEEARVKVANPQLNEAGIETRTLRLEAGLSTPAAAQAYALFALQLSQLAARGAGQATLPVSVRLANGASKPSVLLRPGIDRIRICDLQEGGPMLEQGTTRRDVFRISRAETTVAKDGTPQTRVELDQGTNLLETLQARLALEAAVVGSGAVG